MKVSKMNIDHFNKIYPDVYDELYNSQDYFYLANNYKYKTIEPDIIKYDANRFCDDMIKAFAMYVPNATAEEYAHYIIACMTGAAAVDLFLDHLAQNHTKFNIKSWDGYIDEVVYDSSMPAKFHQSDSCVAGTLFASTATGVNAVNFQIIFT